MDGDLLPAHSHRGKFSPTVGKSNSDLVQENMFIYDIHEKLTPLGKKLPFVLFWFLWGRSLSEKLSLNQFAKETSGNQGACTVAAHWRSNGYLTLFNYLLNSYVWLFCALKYYSHPFSLQSSTIFSTTANHSGAQQPTPLLLGWIMSCKHQSFKNWMKGFMWCFMVRNQKCNPRYGGCSCGNVFCMLLGMILTVLAGYGIGLLLKNYFVKEQSSMRTKGKKDGNFPFHSAPPTPPANAQVSRYIRHFIFIAALGLALVLFGLWC